MKLHQQIALRIFIFASAMVIPFWPARAQAAEKIWRLGFLITGDKGFFSRFLVQGTQRELGYVEGRNIILQSRVAAANQRRLTEAAVELARLQVDVIVARGTQATLAAKKAIATIPIIMTGNSDPAGTELVASLAQPGANVTGMSVLAPDLAEKRLELLKRVIPGPVSATRFVAEPSNP